MCHCDVNTNAIYAFSVKSGVPGAVTDELTSLASRLMLMVCQALSSKRTVPSLVEGEVVTGSAPSAIDSLTPPSWSQILM